MNATNVVTLKIMITITVNDNEFDHDGKCDVIPTSALHQHCLQTNREHAYDINDDCDDRIFYTFCMCKMRTVYLVVMVIVSVSMTIINNDYNRRHYFEFR